MCVASQETSKYAAIGTCSHHCTTSSSDSSAAARMTKVLKAKQALAEAFALLLFLGGSCFYVFTVAALGILLGTVAATMGQFGLLAIPVLLVMMLLSGGTTPMESLPVWLQYLIEGGQPDAAFRRFRPGCALSRRRPLNRMAADFGHGSHRRCLLRVRFALLPQRYFRGLNEKEKAPMRLNYALIASEAKATE